MEFKACVNNINTNTILKTFKCTSWRLSVCYLLQTNHSGSTKVCAQHLLVKEKLGGKNSNYIPARLLFFFPFSVCVGICILWLQLVTVPFCWMSSIKTVFYDSFVLFLESTYFNFFNLDGLQADVVPVEKLLNNCYQLLHYAQEVIFWYLCSFLYIIEPLLYLSEFSWIVLVRLL